MNQPTRDNELEELKRRVSRLERYTEPIQITRLEIESGSLYRKLDDVQEVTNSVETKIDRACGDISQIRDSQADLRDRLISHSDDLKAIKDKQDAHNELRDRLISHSDDLKAIKDKQDAHNELLGQLIGIGEKHTESFTKIKGRLDRVDTRLDRVNTRLDRVDTRLEATATKDDISAFRDEFSAFKATQQQLLQAILDRLPPKQ